MHEPADLFPVDYVYCSHEHPDHFDPSTLQLLPTDQKILLPEFASGVLRNRTTHRLAPNFGRRVRISRRARARAHYGRGMNDVE